MNLRNSLFTAKVMHKRFLPKINQFLYDVFYICLDLDKILEAKSRFFSINKFNLFSFYNKDHGFRDERGLKEWIEKILKQQNIEYDKIFLITHPRVLGYVFNPVSFYFCYKNGVLKAVLCEVNNTFKESHNYLIFDDEIDGEKFYEARKNFHVSPFLKIEGGYKFRFKHDGGKMAIWIDFFNNDKKLQLATSVIGKMSDLNDKNLLKSFVKMPFLTLKVIFLIHFQALKIILKKIKYIKKPLPPINSITNAK